MIKPQTNWISDPLKEMPNQILLLLRMMFMIHGTTNVKVTTSLKNLTSTTQEHEDRFIKKNVIHNRVWKLSKLKLECQHFPAYLSKRKQLSL